VIDGEEEDKRKGGKHFGPRLQKARRFFFATYPNGNTHNNTHRLLLSQAITALGLSVSLSKLYIAVV
jgi:hypothetical protein